jgi:hypothetical protein
MVKGLKQTSSVVAVGFAVSESAANTFTQGSVDLNLSPLDNEVFVVLAVNLDNDFPDAIDGTSTAQRSALTTTSQTVMPNLGDSNCIARTTDAIRCGAPGTIAVGFSQQALETPPSTLEFIGIIATNDFFIQTQGTANLGAKGTAGKVYGYRARADASIYSALVQSEVLSA